MKTSLMRMPPLAWLFVGLAWVSLGVPVALAQERPVTQRIVQSASVLAHYPPLALTLETPALALGRTTFTSQAELEQFSDALITAPRSGAHIARVTLGATPGGRALFALLLTKEGIKTPAEMGKLGRPIVWLIGQQHGNEPAGSEAMLALGKALADGELTSLLDTLSVVIIPRANPDGAAANTRDNAAGFDLNRDHELLTQPEVQMIHGLAQHVPPALVIDAHEFNVGQRWMEKLGGLQAIDLMVLSATHPMVATPLRKLAEDTFLPAIDAAIAPFALKSFVYTTSSRTTDRPISVGGNAPGIARNAFGLMGAVSILLETRGLGIGLESYQRRVATHYIAARALLQTAVNAAPSLVAAVADARDAATQRRRPIIIAHSVAKMQVDLPLIDAVTGQIKSTTVDVLDSRVVTATEKRDRPAGYLVPPDRAGPIVQHMGLLGARTCKVQRAVEVAVESYDVTNRTDSDRRAINPVRSVSIRLRSDRLSLRPGTLFVPLDQPFGSLLALTLEPDSPGSLSAVELLDKNDPGTIAIWRLPPSAAFQDFLSALACTPQ